MKLAIAGVLVVALLAGCKSTPQSEIASNYPTNTSTTPTSVAPTGPTKLPDLSLAVTDMPVGWTTTTDATAVSFGEAGCLKSGSRRPETKSAYYITFAAAGGAPIFSESLASFTASSAAKNYEAAVKTLLGCKSISLKAGKTTLTGPLAATSAPTFGAESQAFTLTAIFGAHVLTEYIVLAHQGNFVLMTAYASVKNPAITDFLSLTTKAVSKLAP